VNEQTIEQIIAEHREAQKVLEGRIEEEKTASRRTTDARNVFNGICKRLDAAVLQMKKEAPWNTDWYSNLHTPQRVE
jgi:hypothetical protein